MRFLTTAGDQQATSGADDTQAPVEAVRTTTITRAAWLAPTILLLAVAIFGVSTLSNFPAVFIDEGWNANRAWSFLQTGHPFASIDSGVYQHYDGYWTYWPYLATLLHAIFVWAFGLSLESIRLASVFFGLILLMIIYFIARRLYDYRTGLIALVLLSTSTPFVLSSHLGRHDIIVTAFGFGAIALYVADRSSSISLKSVLSGLAIGLALDIHLNALVFGPVMLALYLLDYGWSLIRTGRFRGFVLGGAVGAAYFVAMHILPYPQTYFAIGSLGNGISRRPPILTLDLDLWRGAIRGTIDLFDLLLIPVLIPAGIFLANRWSPADKKTMLLAGMLVLGVAALIRYKEPHYAILVAPAISLALAPYIAEITRKFGKVTHWAFWRNVVVLGAVATISVINLAPALSGSNADYRKVVAYLQQTIPNGSLVYGSPTFWLALPTTPYIDWEQITFRQRFVPGSTYTDAFETLKPDYFVIDGYMDLFMYDDNTCHAIYKDVPCMPKTELNTLLKDKATLAGDVKTNEYGDVRIYKMDWAGAGAGEGRK